MIGNHVAQRAGGLIEGTAMFDADSFGGGDLYVVDVGTIPERFNNAVRETENHHILDGLLAEIVIDTIDLLFGEDFLQFLVELNGGSKVVAERVFHDDASPVSVGFLSEAGLAKFLDDGRKEIRRDGKIVEPVALC